MEPYSEPCYRVKRLGNKCSNKNHLQQKLCRHYDLFPIYLKMKILKIKLAQPLAEVVKKKNKVVVAKEIGISVPTLEKILNNSWNYIDRRSIEQVMDYLQMEAKDVFESVESSFWQGIKTAGACTFICGSRKGQPGVEIPSFAFDAAYEIRKFFNQLGHVHCTLENDTQSEEELMNIAKTRNCVLLGSAQSNRATEILVSRFFGVAPFTSDERNHSKIPFGFGWRCLTDTMPESALTYSQAAQRQMNGKPGLAWQGGHVVVDFRSPEEFKDWESNEAVDAALVFVADQPFGTQEQVKLIVLAGVGGIGTLAAARALIRDSLDLQPVGHQKYVFGVVRARYSKIPHQVDGRSYKSFTWLYRRGGPRPLRLKTRVATASKA